MSAVEVTITGTLYDKLARTSQSVVLIGEATLTGIGVGGGPIVPPPLPPGPVDPGWGVGPGVPGTRPPIDPGWGVIPVPPGAPNVPPPGSPPMHVGGTQPAQPMVPPPAVIIDYPGVGKVLVPLPTSETPPVAAPKK